MLPPETESLIFIADGYLSSTKLAGIKMRPHDASMRNFALLDTGINQGLTDTENGGNFFHGVEFFHRDHPSLGAIKNCGQTNGKLPTAGRCCCHHCL